MPDTCGLALSGWMVRVGGAEPRDLARVELLSNPGGSVVLFDDPVVPVPRHDALDLGEEMLVGWSDHEPGAVRP